jgi:exodeoxyribonuclease V gamma subunit
MLHIHHANRIERLRDLLLQRLADGGGVLDAEPVIVPNTALRRWLSLAVADAAGICANLQFGFLALWLWQQLARALPGVETASPLAPARLAWRIHAALCDEQFVAPHARLRAYLELSDPIMRFELTEQLAALFERYVTYRAEGLQAWQQGRPADLGDAAGADAAWQAALWRRIAAELALPDTHPASALGTQALPGLPPRLHLFALPAIAPLHQQWLQRLSLAIEVHVYLLDPCREYWFELVDARRLHHLASRGRAAGHEVGNPLLASWGRQAQQHVEAWVALQGEAGVHDDAHFEPAPGDTLLARLQNALLDLHDLPPGSLALAAGDRSIELHVCHSLQRELEVLQDHLLGLFAANPELSPGDIVVLTPDLAKAAPLIDAIFGTAPAARFIPYRIAGRPRSGTHAPAQALLALLALTDSRCTAGELFALLQQPVVARRFGLDDALLQRLHGWLRDAGFHWALDAAQVQSAGLPPAEAHTLQHALQRLWLGHALPPLADEPFAGLVGAGAAEGTSAQALGALWRFAQGVGRLRQALRSALPPAAWAAVVQQTLDDFVLAQGDELEDQRALQATLLELVDDVRSGGGDAALPPQLLRFALQRRLDEAAAGATAGGSLNFASMSGLRGLPFAVVCAIGLGDGAFPATQRPAEFDLMALKPRRGDRNRRDDERGLMLDLLQSARTGLYLSYTGRSQRDNQPLPPSVLVAELIDLLLQATAAARERLVVEHPLQPFSARAFDAEGDARQRSHDSDLADALRHRLGRDAKPVDDDLDGIGDDDDDDLAPHDRLLPFFAAALPAPDAAWRQVSPARLIEFFRQPCRYLLRRRLHIELPRAEDELQDDEPLVADGRARSALARRLLPAALRGLGPDELAALAKAGNELPEGRIGQRQLLLEVQRLHGFGERVREATAAPCLPPFGNQLDFEIDGEAWSLHTAWADLRHSGLIGWRCGDSRATDYLQAWLLHLSLSAAAPPAVVPTVRWLSTDGEFSFEPVETPLPLLKQLLLLYRRGLMRPLHFFPRSAWSYARHGLPKARAEWLDNPARPGEQDDAAYRLALRGIDEPLDAQFESTAAAVFGPLLDHLLDDRVKP